MRRDQFERQAKFTDRYIEAMRKGVPLTELTKEYVLSLHREADEILDEVPWKGHRRYDSIGLVQSNIAEEIIDVVKYAFGLAHLHGLTYDELVQEFDIKSDVVDDRWRQEHEAFPTDRPIALIDLDGVLNKYPEPFLEFVRQHFVEYKSMEELEKWPRVKAQAKHLYRQSGIKRTLPPIMESVAATQRLSTKYSIVIMSQRPYDRYRRIYGDTLHWLRVNDVPYDRLVFVRDKEHKLVLSPFRDRIAFAVDDDPNVVVQLCALGIRTYWLTDRTEPDRGGVAQIVRSMLDIPEVKQTEDVFSGD